jgi:hypothetical protein
MSDNEKVQSFTKPSTGLSGTHCSKLISSEINDPEGPEKFNNTVDVAFSDNADTCTY